MEVPLNATEEHVAISVMSQHLIMKDLVKVICRCAEMALEGAKSASGLLWQSPITYFASPENESAHGVAYYSSQAYLNLLSEVYKIWSSSLNHTAGEKKDYFTFFSLWQLTVAMDRLYENPSKVVRCRE